MAKISGRHYRVAKREAELQHEEGLFVPDEYVESIAMVACAVAGIIALMSALFGFVFGRCSR